MEFAILCLKHMTLYKCYDSVIEYYEQKCPYSWHVLYHLTPITTFQKDAVLSSNLRMRERGQLEVM